MGSSQQENSNSANCPCGLEHEGAKWIQCGSLGCDSPWWHLKCAGLEGLTDGAIRKIKYSCPRCAVAALGINGVKNNAFSDEISKEIKKCLPSIVKEVVQETSVTLSKSYADSVKKENKAMLKETVKSTSQTALKETLKRVDANLTEQRKRTRNLIISGVDERENENVQEEVINVLQKVEEKFPSGQILSCKRLGPKKNENSEQSTTRKHKSRMILVTLRNENDAVFFHRNGYGRKLSENIWLNADLTKDEREAKYKLRVQKREKAKELEEKSPQEGSNESAESKDGDSKN